MVKAHETTWTDGEDCFEWWINEGKDKERLKKQWSIIIYSKKTY